VRRVVFCSPAATLSRVALFELCTGSTTLPYVTAVTKGARSVTADYAKGPSPRRRRTARTSMTSLVNQRSVSTSAQGMHTSVSRADTRHGAVSAAAALDILQLAPYIDSQGPGGALQPRLKVKRPNVGDLRHFSRARRR
jgi:hypothetical protein